MNQSDQSSRERSNLAGGTRPRGESEHPSLPLIAAPLTADGRGAIAVVGVHGHSAHEAVLKCFSPATEVRQLPLSVNRIRFGHWKSSESVVVVPTGENEIEVHCHGGRAAVESILDDLKKVGVQRVDGTQYLTARGMPAEVVAMRELLCHTNTARTAGIALDQARGRMRDWAIAMQSNPSANDFPTLRAHIADVLAFEAIGKHLVTPWQVVIAGPPNVGKSSLINALLGYQRSITFDQPGTTRDVISADTAFDGWPIRISDTAGVRCAEDEIEATGVQLASKVLESADIVLLVLDATEGIHETHHSILARTQSPVVAVYNKVDLLPADAKSDDDLFGNDQQFQLKHRFAAQVMVSALTSVGIEQLVQCCVQELVPNLPGPEMPVPVTELQREVLHQALLADTIDECQQLMRMLIY